MSGPAKWDWNSSSANSAAYVALTSHGRTADFTAAVWNNILTKISEQRVSWTDTPWNVHGTSLQNTQMSSGDNMTAIRFNSAVKNMPPIRSWPWQADLGRTDIHKGDMCKGSYFIYLTDGLNHWIDLIPIPFSFGCVGELNITPDGVALPAVHAIGECVFEWGADTTVRVDQSVHVKIMHESTMDQSLSMSFLNGADIRFVIFYHVNIANKTTLYDTAHVIARLRITSQRSALVSVDTCDFIVSALNFSHSISGKLSPDLYDSICTHLCSEVAIEPQIALMQKDAVICDMTLHLQGEPLIIERDSVPIKTDVNSIADMSMALSPTAQIPAPFIANVNSQTDILAKINVLSGVALETHLSNIFNPIVSAVSAPCAHTGATVQSAIDFTASATILSAALSVAASIVSESSTQIGIQTKLTEKIKVSMPINSDLSTGIHLIGYTGLIIDMLYQHITTASAALSEPCRMCVGLTMHHVGCATVHCPSLTDTGAQMTFTSDMHCGLTCMALTLVSTLDDVLISELDDMLVSDVECS